MNSYLEGDLNRYEIDSLDEAGNELDSTDPAARPADEEMARVRSLAGRSSKDCLWVKWAFGDLSSSSSWCAVRTSFPLFWRDDRLAELVMWVESSERPWMRRDRTRVFRIEHDLRWTSVDVGLSWVEPVPAQVF